MRSKTTKFFLIATALFLGAQGLFAFSTSCPQRSDEHRCCRESKRPALSQIKKAPPCVHCFEKANPGRLVAASSLQAQIQIPVVQSAASPYLTALSTVRVFLPEHEIPHRLKIPLLLRQMLI